MNNLQIPKMPNVTTENLVLFIVIRQDISIELCDPVEVQHNKGKQKRIKVLFITVM